MRQTLALLTLFALLLAACGGNAPAATSAPQNSSVNQSAPTQGSSVTSVPPPAAVQPTVMERMFETNQPPLPQPGTAAAPTTPDPDAGLLFDSIVLERSGGIAGETLVIEVYADGRVVRNGASSTITPDQVQMIDSLIDQSGFFGLQGVFTAPGTSADLYRYNVTVERAGSRRMIPMQEDLIPQELAGLVTLLNDLGT